MMYQCDDDDDAISHKAKRLTDQVSLIIYHYLLYSRQRINKTINITAVSRLGTTTNTHNAIINSIVNPRNNTDR